VRSALSFLLVALALYGILLAVLYIWQRTLLYPASSFRTTAAQAGLRGFQDVTLATEDGERIVGWYKEPASPAGPSYSISTAMAAACGTGAFARGS